MILQSSETSEELAGYLGWTSQNFYDLLNYDDNPGESLLDFSMDMSAEVSKAQQERKIQLETVKQQRQAIIESNIFSNMYKIKEEDKMRSIFPYYFKESIVPDIFRRNFLSILDSTIR